MLTINFTPFPILETENLVLRRPALTDVDEIFKYRSDKTLMRHIPHRLATHKDEVVATIAFIDGIINTNEGINWAVTQKGSDLIIGMVGYVHINKAHHRAEIGYMLHTPYHGKGIMDEAVKMVIDYGFDSMKLHSIEAIVNSNNTASKKLLERLGFSKDAFFKDYLHHAGSFMDANVYSLLSPR